VSGLRTIRRFSSNSGWSSACLSACSSSQALTRRPRTWRSWSCSSSGCCDTRPAVPSSPTRPGPPGGGKPHTSSAAVDVVVPGHAREALTIEVNRTIDADAAVAVLDRVVVGRGTAPRFIRCNNGPELTANALRDWCRLTSADELLRARPALAEPPSTWRASVAGLRDQLLAFRGRLAVLRRIGPRLNLVRLAAGKSVILTDGTTMTWPCANSTSSAPPPSPPLRPPTSPAKGWRPAVSQCSDWPSCWRPACCWLPCSPGRSEPQLTAAPFPRLAGAPDALGDWWASLGPGGQIAIGAGLAALIALSGGSLGLAFGRRRRQLPAGPHNDHPRRRGNGPAARGCLYKCLQLVRSIPNPSVAAGLSNVNRAPGDLPKGRSSPNIGGQSLTRRLPSVRLGRQRDLRRQTYGVCRCTAGLVPAAGADQRYNLMITLARGGPG
jgi:hypothetical protein